MLHGSPLIALLSIGFGLAFVFGAVATRLKLSPLAGYLVAGVVIGPFTPGFTADAGLAAEVAEVGVILLMFGVGLHFSPSDLLSARAVAVPVALLQIMFATAAGVGFALALGWSFEAGILLGLALSVSSTVVALRSLQERRLMQTERGKLTVGWLVVEDLAMVVAMVLLPTWVHIRTQVVNGEAISVLQMQDAGLAVALGALFAGLIMAESELSQQAANETLPLRDAFAVLFFVSVGMLFDSMILLRNPWPLIATVGIILVLRSLISAGLLKLFGQSRETTATVTASRAQIGEFSFILAGLGLQFGPLPDEANDLILGGAIISIVLSPLMFAIFDRIGKKAQAVGAVRLAAPTQAPPKRVVLVGYGRVGSLIGKALDEAQATYSVIEDREDLVELLNSSGVAVIAGNAISQDTTERAGIAQADVMFVTVPNGFEAGRIVELARTLNPKIKVYARAHSDAEVEHLRSFGADLIVSGEQEIADAMIEKAAAVIPRRIASSA